MNVSNITPGSGMWVRDLSASLPELVEFRDLDSSMPAIQLQPTRPTLADDIALVINDVCMMVATGASFLHAEVVNVDSLAKIAKGDWSTEELEKILIQFLQEGVCLLWDEENGATLFEDGNVLMA